MGGMGREALLNDLHVCITVTERLDLGNDEDGPMLGDLHVVVNDVTGDLDTSRKALDSWLQLEQVPSKGKEIQDIKRRNEVRQAIKRAFAAVHFHPLPAPSSDAGWVQNESGPFDQLSPEYGKASEAFVGALLQSLATEMQQCGTAVDGLTMVPLLKQIAKAVKDDDVVNVPNAVDAIKQQLADQQLEAAELQCEVKMDEVVEKTTSQLAAQGLDKFRKADVEKQMDTAVESAETYLRTKLASIKLRDSASDKLMKSLQDTGRRLRANAGSKLQAAISAEEAKVAERKRQEAETKAKAEAEQRQREREAAEQEQRRLREKAAAEEKQRQEEEKRRRRLEEELREEHERLEKAERARRQAEADRLKQEERQEQQMQKAHEEQQRTAALLRLLGW